MELKASQKISSASSSRASNPEAQAARMALLHMAVKKIPFTTRELREANPEMLGETLRNQVRRLESEGLITRLSLGRYVATCVLHLFSDEVTKGPKSPPAPRPQVLAVHRMPQDKLLDYLSTPRIVGQVAQHFGLGATSARDRLRHLISEGIVHRREIGQKIFYAAREEDLVKVDRKPPSNKRAVAASVTSQEKSKVLADA